MPFHEAYFNQDGLSPGVTLVCTSGSAGLARDTTGVVPLGGGAYGKQITYPAGFLSGYLLWDSPGLLPRSEPVNLGPAVNASGYVTITNPLVTPILDGGETVTPELT